MSTVD